MEKTHERNVANEELKKVRAEALATLPEGARVRLGYESTEYISEFVPPAHAARLRTAQESVDKAYASVTLKHGNSHLDTGRGGDEEE